MIFLFTKWQKTTLIILLLFFLIISFLVFMFNDNQKQKEVEEKIYNEKVLKKQEQDIKDQLEIMKKNENDTLTPEEKTKMVQEELERMNSEE